jgi:hypothetical protein
VVHRAVKNGMDSHTCNPFLRPMMNTESVVRAVINLLGGHSTVENPLLLTWHRLGKVAQSIPLTTLLWTFISGRANRGNR